MSEDWKAAMQVMLVFICMAALLFTIGSFWYWVVKAVVDLCYGG
jgi:hypothetical protein